MAAVRLATIFVISLSLFNFSMFTYPILARCSKPNIVISFASVNKAVQAIVCIEVTWLVDTQKIY